MDRKGLQAEKQPLFLLSRKVVAAFSEQDTAARSTLTGAVPEPTFPSRNVCLLHIRLFCFAAPSISRATALYRSLVLSQTVFGIIAPLVRCVSI